MHGGADGARGRNLLIRKDGRVISLGGALGPHPPRDGIRNSIDLQLRTPSLPTPEIGFASRHPELVAGESSRVSISTTEHTSMIGSALKLVRNPERCEVNLSNLERKI